MAAVRYFPRYRLRRAGKLGYRQCLGFDPERIEEICGTGVRPLRGICLLLPGQEHRRPAVGGYLGFRPHLCET
jgi:hypothetical protein